MFSYVQAGTDMISHELYHRDIPFYMSSDHGIVQYDVGACMYDQYHYEDRSETSSFEASSFEVSFIDTLIMHYTAAPVRSTIDMLTDRYSLGTAHYVITRREPANAIPGGHVIKFVPEHKRALHAGDGCWDGCDTIDDTSIGINNVHPGVDIHNNWHFFDSKQIDTLGQLSQSIVERYNIPPTRVLGHADVAPRSTIDPGVMFPWKELYYMHDVGAWLESRDPSSITASYAPAAALPGGVSVPFVLTGLKQLGYDVGDCGYNTPDNHAVVKAFKSHFSANQQPTAYHATITRHDMIWIWGLLAKYYPDRLREL